MNKVILLRGLPASGKSTWAKEFMSKNSNYKRINKDDLRAMIDNNKWSKDNERFILVARNILLDNALSEGFSVIIDDTNFADKHIGVISNIANKHNAVVEIKDFNTPVWECIERDEKRENPVGKKVIWKMYMDYVADFSKNKEFICDKGKVSAIICDIDGTLAHMHNRKPFDYNKVSTDICDVFINDVIEKYSDSGFDIILCSGREDSCEDITKKWLEDNNVKYNKLFMREAGDNRPDYEVKKEIYENKIKPFYNIFFCLDDRDQVVRLWRELGLKCLQVEYGNF